MALTQISTDGIKNGTITGSDLATNLDLSGKLTCTDIDILDTNAPALRLSGTSDDSNTGLRGFLGIATSANNFCNGSAAGDVVVVSPERFIVAHNADEVMAVFNDDGAVDLRYNGSKKFETTSTGATITGSLQCTLPNAHNEGITLQQENSKSVRFLSNAFRSGASQGLLSIQSAWTGTAVATIDTTTVGSTSSKGAEIKFKTAHAGGSLTERVKITSTGNLQIPNDTGKLQLGASDDLQIYHTGTLSRIDNNTGDLLIRTNVASDVGGNIYLKPHDDEDGIIITHDAGVELYYDGSKKFETQSGGITVNGNANFGDNKKTVFGDGSDLKIYHDGSESVIGNSTGTFQFLSPNEIRYRATTHHFLSYANDESMAKFNDDGAVELYWNNSLRASTDNQGLLLPSGKGVCFGDVGCKVSGVPGGGGSAGISFMVNSGGSWKIDGNGVFLNNNRNEAPSSLKGAIHFKPSASGGSTGILFNSNVNTNSDCGYIWWYDDNNNYRINDSSENGALVIGIQNDGNATSEDAVAIESSGNIFLNPGNDGGLGNAGGVTGPDFSEGKVYIGRAASKYEVFHGGSHSLPDADNTYDLGSSSKRFRFVYTTDLQLSNENTGGNEVDGTWGNYTIQEGADDLFLINRRSGKRYKFNLTEVS